jgi:FkbM family methyltransferase
MKTAIKNWLKQTGLLHRIQYHSAYREWKNKGIGLTLMKLKVFYQELFQGEKPSLIFDIGANVGDHTLIFSSLSTKVISVEPDFTNIQVLRSRLRNKRNVEVLDFAIADVSGERVFNVISEGNPFNSLSDKWVKILSDDQQTRFQEIATTDKKIIVKTLTLTDLFKKYGTPDYIKIDVEGFEWQVVSQLDRKIPILSFECNLPEFAEETCRILNKLNEINPHATFNFIRDESWELEAFVDKENMASVVNSGEFRFMEIFCLNK